jgi:DNA-binding SARP family transcriptional activator
MEAGVTLRVHLTGRLAVERDETLVDAAAFPARQGRIAFAYLATHRRPVTRDELAEQLWRGAPSKSWERDLSAVISKLRSALAPFEGDAEIVSAFGCYELRIPDDGVVDVEAAAGEVEIAEAALAAGELERARAAATVAATVARRPLLPGDDAPWLDEWRSQLRSTLVRSLDVMVEVLDRTGRADEAVRSAEELIELEPLRERGYVQLMRVHHRHGERAQALRVYERCRARLADELGVDPAPETEAAYLEILRDDLGAETRSPAKGDQQPLPPIIAALARPDRFVGREQPMTALHEAFQAARDGRLRVVLVAGDPGIGKSRLVAEFAAAAHAAGADVAAARCDPDGVVPFRPIVECLRLLLGTHSARHEQARAGDRTPDLGVLLPELAGAGAADPTEEPGELDRYRLFEAVKRFIADAALDRPLVLVLEDLQWVDTPTLRLLRHLVRSAEPAGVVIVGTHREAELDAAGGIAQALAELRREDCVTRVPLDGLDPAQIRALLRTPLPTAESRHLATALHVTTEGNPFFVHEILASLVESGQVALIDGRWIPGVRIDRLTVPNDVKVLLGHRLARLSDDAKTALLTASVIGREFDLDVLAAVTGTGEDELLELLDEALTVGAIEDVAGVVDRFSFSHALVRETLVDELGASRRVRLHARIATTIERLHADDLDPFVPALAHHFAEAAGRERSEPAVDYARRAARRALDQRGYEEAANHLERALEHLENDDPLGLKLLLDLGDAHNRAGDLDAARLAFEQATARARELGDVTAQAKAALGSTLQPTSTLAGSYDLRDIEVLDAALAALPQEDSPLRATLVARLARESYWSPREPSANVLADEALAMARRVEDPLAVADALFAKGWCSPLHEPLQQLETATELLEMAAQTGRPEDELWARLLRMQWSRSVADFEALAGDAGSFSGLADQLRMPAFQWYSVLWEATVAYFTGRFADAERLSRAAYDLGWEPHGTTAGLHFFGQRMQLRREQGRLGELVPIIEAYAADREVTQTPILRLLLAWMYADVGRLADARASAEPLLADDPATAPENYNWLLNMVLLAELAYRLDDDRHAARLLELLGPHTSSIAFTGCGSVCWGPAARAAGQVAMLLERDDEAEQLFELALERCEVMRSPVWRARTEHDFATMLVRRDRAGDRERAVRVVESARATADELGMTLLQRRLRELADLIAPGASAPR